jgi:hypothetical protein
MPPSGEVDIEDWYFGEGTLDALLTFQACESLPETGVVDQATWDALLEGHGDSSEASSSSSSQVSSSSSAGGAGRAASPAAAKSLLSWPVLMETDGGREVHHLQVSGLLRLRRA